MGKKTEKRTETNALVLKLDNGKKIKLHLERNDNYNTIDLLVSDAENIFDPSWYVVSIQGSGTLVKYIHIPDEVGLTLKSNGAIKTSKEDK